MASDHMTDIHALNERRAKARAHIEALQIMNVPEPPEERLKADARRRLAFDAWEAAEHDYAVAIRRLSTEELLLLANTPPPDGK